MTYYYALYDDGMDIYYDIHKASTKKNALAGLRRLVRSSGTVGMLFSSEPPEGPFRRTPKNIIGIVNELGKTMIYIERTPRKKFDNWPTWELRADGSLGRRV